VDSVRLTVLVCEYAAFESPLLAQHGLSILAEVTVEGSRRRILIDAGQDGEVVVSNMRRLGLDPGTIDMVFLTHNHFDHSFGLAGVLRAVGQRVPVVGHSRLFRETVEDVGRRPLWRLGLTDSVDRQTLVEAGADFILVDEPVPLMPGVYSTGTIDRTAEFEQPGEAETTYAVVDGRLVEDTGVDDLSLAFNVRECGLVIVTGCSHAGVVNIVRTAKRVTGVERVAGLIGGFHLLFAGQDRLAATAEEFEGLGIDRVVAGHCTGFKACATLQARLGDRFELLLTGDSYTFPRGG